jgi:YVTN family beta-propeller protein
VWGKVLVGLGLLVALGACDGNAPTANTPVAQSSPQGRIVIANQGSDSVTVLDVATNGVVGTVPTGASPHHAISTPDGKEFWVTLFKENHLQIFDSATLQPLGQVDIGGASDDLAFAPDGQRLYVSMGQDNQVAVIDVPGRKLLGKVGVGQIPHGIKVRPDNQELYVTNTRDNTVSVLTLQPEAKLAITFRTGGADPFEVTFDGDGKTAYVSNFLADSVTMIDTATRQVKGTIKSGKQPAMLSFVPGLGGTLLWIANTGSEEIWVVDPATRKLVQRLPAGGGAHGVVATPAGKVFVTNTTANNVMVLDAQAGTLLTTIAVGTNPNGLGFVPPVK